MTKRLKIVSRDFYVGLQQNVPTFSLVIKFYDKILKLGWDGCRLRDAISEKERDVKLLSQLL